MLNENELDTAISSFISRKQKQFPDINLSDDRQTTRLMKALGSRSDFVNKNYRPLRNDLKSAW
jgi:hypothetical protein